MFDDQWLHDPEFSFWVSGVPGDDIAYCKLCKKDISVYNGGKSALRAHAKGKKHSELAEWGRNETAVQPVCPTYVSRQNCYIANEYSASTSTGNRLMTFQPKQMPRVSSSARYHPAPSPRRQHVKKSGKVVVSEEIRYGNRSVSRVQKSLEFSSCSETTVPALDGTVGAFFW